MTNGDYTPPADNGGGSLSDAMRTIRDAVQPMTPPPSDAPLFDVRPDGSVYDSAGNLVRPAPKG